MIMIIMEILMIKEYNLFSYRCYKDLSENKISSRNNSWISRLFEIVNNPKIMFIFLKK